MPKNTTMYGPPEGCWVSVIIDPIQIQPQGITVHSEKAPSTITATTNVAARLAPAAGTCPLASCAMYAGYAAAAPGVIPTAARPAGPDGSVIVTPRVSDSEGYRRPAVVGSG